MQVSSFTITPNPLLAPSLVWCTERGMCFWSPGTLTFLSCLSSPVNWTNLKTLPRNIREVSLTITSKGVHGLKYLPPTVTSLKLICHAIPSDINRIPATVTNLVLNYHIKVSETSDVPFHVTVVSFGRTVEPIVLARLGQRPKLNSVSLLGNYSLRHLKLPDATSHVTLTGGSC